LLSEALLRCKTIGLLKITIFDSKRGLTGAHQLQLHWEVVGAVPALNGSPALQCSVFFPQKGLIVWQVPRIKSDTALHCNSCEYREERKIPATGVSELKMSPAQEVPFPAIILVFWGTLFHSPDKTATFADLLLQ